MNPIVHPRLSQILDTQQIPHALLFSGPPEIISQSASSFSLTLLKSHKKIDQHPDIHLLFPEGKTRMHPIESIRHLTEDAMLSSFEGSWKIFILHEAEKMLPTSSNALLKILEEPPSKTLFILLSEYPQKLLPTILSRCQHLTFQKMGAKAKEETLLKILSGELPQENLSNFDSSDPYAIFETLLFWHRDRLALELQVDPKLLHFPEYRAQNKKNIFIPLEKVEQAVKQIRLAYERSTKLSSCLEIFFIQLQKN